MHIADKYKVGDRVYLNMACPFVCRSDPQWVVATITKKSDTHFFARTGTDTLVKKFWAHSPDQWRDYA